MSDMFRSKNVCTKICGLMNEDDVRLCLSLGVKRIGFVTEFPTPVPWNVTRQKAKELRSILPDDVEAVVVTGGDVDKILNIADIVKPNYIQMHCDKELNIMKDLIKALKDRNICVILKYPTSNNTQLEIFNTDDEKTIVETMVGLGIKEILIDPRTKENAAAKNLSADTDLVRRIGTYSEVPVILAGGITPDNILEKLNESGARSVDVMNGSETEPGKKSKEMIVSLLEKVKQLNV